MKITYIDHSIFPILKLYPSFAVILFPSASEVFIHLTEALEFVAESLS